MKTIISSLFFSLILTIFTAVVLYFLFPQFFGEYDYNWCNTCFQGEVRQCTMIACAPRYGINKLSVLLLIPIFLAYIFLYRVLRSQHLHLKKPRKT